MDDKLNWKDKVELAIEAGLQLVPTVGGSLASLYFGTKQEKRFKRIESFYRELAQQMEQQRITPLSIESHNPEALAHLIEELNDKIEQEHLDRKRQYFKKFFMNSLSSPTTDQSFDKRKFFLDCLSDMSLLEIDLLGLLQHHNQPIQISSINKQDVDQYLIVGSFGKLRNYGFIKVFTGHFAVGGGIDNTLSEIVELSSFGKEFIDYCLFF